MKNEIKYLKRNEIVDAKWNHCIDHSPNGLIYGYTWYLDHMADNWDALVLNDYEAVMPLPWRKKWGIKYLYQPAFTQQGGIFYIEELGTDIMEKFLTLAFQRFSFAEIALNFQNNADISYINSQWRNNFILPLRSIMLSGEEGSETYVQKRVRRAQKHDLQYIPTSDIHEAVNVYRQLYQSRMPSIKEMNYFQLIKMCEHHPEHFIIRKVLHREKLVALVLMLKDKKRLYNIISCILPEGKTLLANYFLYDKIINEFSSTSLILDFEGSDVESIAYFYKKFTKQNQYYPFIKFNRLPWWARLFKK